MSRIAYDPTKDRFARLIRNSRLLRTLFYKLLDLFFLRGWYVRQVLRDRGNELERAGEWSLLDAGCGFGQYDRFILKEFDRVSVTAVDVKKDYLEDAARYFSDEREEGRIRFREMDLLEPDYEALDTYDFVLCVDVLEHIEEDVKVMRNLERAMKPGGWFLMHSPSIFAEADAEGDETFVDEHARTGYSKEDIRDKMEQAGLLPVEVAYTYGPRGHKAWEWLIKRPMLWLTHYSFLALPLVALWYLFILVPGLILMKLDMKDENEQGTGIYALARKSNA